MKQDKMEVKKKKRRVLRTLKTFFAGIVFAATTWYSYQVIRLVHILINTDGWSNKTGALFVVFMMLSSFLIWWGFGFSQKLYETMEEE